MSNLTDARRPSPPPPLAATVAATGAAIVLFAFIRLYLYTDRSVPLTYALPLLLGVWHKNRSIHWVATVFMAVIAGIQVLWLFPNEVVASVSRPTSYVMMLANIGIVAVVVDRLITSQRRLRESYIDLESANHELETSNAELAAREEEISSQNEELQSQAEELEHQNEELQQQSEELQQQSEEMQQQSEELQQLNDDAVHRQRVLQTLLRASTTPPSSEAVTSAAERICEAALSGASDGAAGALVLVQQEEDVIVLGACNVEHAGTAVGGGRVFDDPLVATVMQERRTAAIEDLTETPEIKAPRGADGVPFRAALVAPILNADQAVGAIVLYAASVRRWTQSEFQIAEWLAAQAGMVLLSARLQQELDRRREEAEDASQRKTRFLAAVSHDVRTPANAISLTAEVIKKAHENPSWAHEIPELAETLRSNAKLLVELVSDVLDLARFDSGKVDVEATEFNLQEMVGREVAQYESLAKSAGLTLAGSTDCDTIWLRTDRMKLARVLGNLIGNAIKFTDRGTIEVECTRNVDGLVEVHVHDTGVGIQPTHLEHIFDEFFQIKNPERDRSKGTGLGLAICKRLVDAIGCSLSVRSKFGEGTTFTIRIPQELAVEAPRVAAPRGQQQQQPQPRQVDRRLAGTRILLVEDHESTRMAFSRLLGAHGAQVDLAADGREALRQLNHDPPDIVLLDLMLPDMDGREVLRKLASHRPPRLRCILAVSGDASEERRQEVESLGADGLVPKPLQIAPLIDRICEASSTKPDAAINRSKGSVVAPQSRQISPGH